MALGTLLVDEIIIVILHVCSVNTPISSELCIYNEKDD